MIGRRTDDRPIGDRPAQQRPSTLDARGRPRGERRPRTLAEHGGDRAISTSLSHVFALAITSVLLVTILVSATGFVEEQQSAVAGQQLETIGGQLASDVHRIDNLAARGGNVSMRSTLPATVSGEPYSVRLAEGAACRTGTLDAEDCLVLSSEGAGATQRVPVNVTTDVTLSKGAGGTLTVSATDTGGGTSVVPDVVEQVFDRDLRIGVGESFTVTSEGSVASPVNRPPVSKFEFAPGIPSEGDTITFDATDSRDPDGSIDSYEWDFDGDGTTDDTGETVTRVLPPGPHDVALTVTDNEDGVSTITRTVQISGLAYENDLDTTGSDDDVLTFSMTNHWPSSVDGEIMLTQILVDPADGGIDEIYDRDCGWSCDYHLTVDADGDGSVDEAIEFSGTDIEDGGLVENLDTTVTVDAGDTPAFSLGEFPTDMSDERVTVGIRYEVDGRTNSTVFTDTPGAPNIDRFYLERDPGDPQQINAVIESSSEIDVGAIAADYEGTPIGGGFVDRSGAVSGYRYVNDDVNGPDTGVIKVNLTSAPGPGGTEASELAGGNTLNRSIVVIDGDYVWSSATDWDDGTDRRLVHDAYGDRTAGALELGYDSTGVAGTDLVGYWSFDGTVDDASPEGNDGAPQGSPADDLGVFGTGSYQFDGGDDYVELDDPLSDTHADASSLSFWLRTTEDGDDTMWQAPGITGIEHSGGDDDIFWGWIDGSGRIGIQAGNDDAIKSTTAVTDGAWHHVVLTYESDGSAQVYVDGTLQDAGTTRDLPTLVDAFESLGRIEDTGGSPEHFEGSLDEVRAYDTVLSDDDAERLYNASSNGTMTTGWKSGPEIDGGDLGIEYRADVPSDTGINVTVHADVDGDGTAEESDVIELSDGGGTAAVAGLSGEADEYRLEIELTSDSPTKSPTLQAVALKDTS